LKSCGVIEIRASPLAKTLILSQVDENVRDIVPEMKSSTEMRSITADVAIAGCAVEARENVQIKNIKSQRDAGEPITREGAV